MRKLDTKETNAYREGFYECKKLILNVLSGFFAGLFGDGAFEKSVLFEMLNSLEIKAKGDEATKLDA